MLAFLVVVEIAAVFSALYATLLARGGTLWQACILTVCHVASLYYNDLYDIGIVRRFSDFLSALPRAFGWSLILLAVSWGLLPDARVSGEALGMATVALVAVLLPARAVGYALWRWRPLREKVLILGAGRLARQIGAEIESRPNLRLEVVGYVGESVDADPAAPPSLGEVSRIDSIIRETAPQRIIVALPERRLGLPIRRLVELRLNGIAVEDGEEFYERITGKIILESLSPSRFVFGRSSGKTRLHRALARVISLGVSAAGLALTAPVFVLVALAIRLDSAGPVFFVQDRVGRRGRRYKMLKFRTMIAVEHEASAWAGDNRERITRVGAFLRRFRLDELPQFVNILLGHMNLVGPRPHPASNFRLFATHIPEYELRLAVRPGVTGWAQTRYFYADNLEQETEKVRYDLYYIKHLSIWLDIRIIIDTIKVVLLGRRSDMTQPQHDLGRNSQTSRVRDTAA